MRPEQMPPRSSLKPPLRQHHARHAIKRIIARGLVEMMGMVGTPGLEPGRPIKPTDFKSVVFTNFTMPPWLILLQAEKLVGVSYPMRCASSNRLS